MPGDKMVLISHGFQEEDLASSIRAIDADRAGCFSDTDRQLILRHILAAHGTVAQFNTYLRLRLLLRPLSYEGDIRTLLGRTTDAFDFRPLRAELTQAAANAGGSALACVCARSGQGKSTLAAALTQFAPAPDDDDPGDNGTVAQGQGPSAAATQSGGGGGGGGAALPRPPWVHAWHFCKHNDARRQARYRFRLQSFWQNQSDPFQGRAHLTRPRPRLPYSPTLLFSCDTIARTGSQSRRRSPSSSRCGFPPSPPP